MVRRQRRFWSDEEKRRIVAQTRTPGVSVSFVARRYDVNANLVFKWLRDPRYRLPVGEAVSFLPVEIAPIGPHRFLGRWRRVRRSRLNWRVARGFGLMRGSTRRR